MDTLLVTGASGFLGRYLLSEGRDSYEVVGTRYNSPIEPDIATTVSVDLTNPPLNELRKYDPEYIIHCAALADVDACEREPQRAHRLNVGITEHIAKFAAATDATLLVISTDAVFDGSRSFWNETDEPNPINIYGETKRAAERVAQRIHSDVTVVRTNFFGWTPGSRNSLAEWMLNTLAVGEELTGFQNVFFTPMYAGDVAERLLTLLQTDCPDIVHLAGSERVSKFRFAQTIATVFDYNSSLVTPIHLSDIDLDAPRGNDLSLDNSRAERILGETAPTVRAGLERMKAEDES